MIIRHHLSIDVEEYFHASALEPYIPGARWDGLPRKSPVLVGRILRLLADARIRGTFFVLGWLAEREPEVVRAIAGEGHEVASHGWDHQRVTALSPAEFRGQVRESRAILRELSGQEVVGYRAPSFSIGPETAWAFDVLLEEGYSYDSSLFPIGLHPGYGHAGAPRDPHVLRRAGGSLVEVPPATWKVGGVCLPAAGGAYLRFFPSGLVRRALTAAAQRGAPGTLYLHPWELDEGMPPIPAPWKTRLRMRGGIGGVPRKLSLLTGAFSFRPIIDTVREVLASASGEGR